MTTTDDDMLTVELATVEQAEYLMDTLAGCRTPGMSTGNIVTITAEGLERLAGLSEDSDGHFDGSHVWIGGTGYVAQS